MIWTDSGINTKRNVLEQYKVEVLAVKLLTEQRQNGCHSATYASLTEARMTKR